MSERRAKAIRKSMRLIRFDPITLCTAYQKTRNPFMSGPGYMYKRIYHSVNHFRRIRRMAKRLTERFPVEFRGWNAVYSMSFCAAMYRVALPALEKRLAEDQRRRSRKALTELYSKRGIKPFTGSPDHPTKLNLRVPAKMLIKILCGAVFAWLVLWWLTT